MFGVRHKHNHYPKVQGGISKVELLDGLWPLWAYGPHGPRAIFFKFLYKIKFKKKTAYFYLILFYFFCFLYYFIFIILSFFLENNNYS